MRINDVLEIMNEKAPLKLSDAACEKLGAYDNSGLIIEGREEQTPSVVFALDLCEAVAEFAEKSGSKLIITHHPAIYRPIKRITRGVYTRCIENGITVYSTHLSLDTAEGGIEDGLARACGAETSVILEPTDFGRGFGRSFEADGATFAEQVERITRRLGARRFWTFGDPDTEIDRIATFCGSGLDEAAIERASDCQMLVSADIPHHVLLAASERGKCVLQLTHYASEAAAMREFARKTCDEYKINYRFYLDERFM